MCSVLKRPVMRFRKASIPMVIGATSALTIYRPLLCYLTPNESSGANEFVSPDIEYVHTIPEYLQKLKSIQNKRTDTNHTEMVKALMKWKPSVTFSNPSIFLNMSSELLEDLDYMRVMYSNDKRNPIRSTTKELVYSKWERCVKKVNTDDEMAFMIHLAHYYGLNEI